MARKSNPESVVRDSRRKTRRKYSSEEKIRMRPSRDTKREATSGEVVALRDYRTPLELLPFSIDTSFDYTLDATTSIDLSVYDVAGRRVRALATGRRGPGAHRAVWDGADSHGRRVASGVYFVRLRTRARAVAHRVTVLR